MVGLAIRNFDPPPTFGPRRGQTPSHFDANYDWIQHNFIEHGDEILASMRENDRETEAEELESESARRRRRIREEQALRRDADPGRPARISNDLKLPLDLITRLAKTPRLQ